MQALKKRHMTGIIMALLVDVQASVLAAPPAPSDIPAPYRDPASTAMQRSVQQRQAYEGKQQAQAEQKQSQVQVERPQTEAGSQELCGKYASIAPLF